MKISVFIAISLDGYISRKDGSIDWLNKANERVPSGEDCGFSEFFNSVDTLIMGRNSYEQVLTFKQWPYESKPVIVLSSKKISIPEFLPKTVSMSSESPKELVKRLSLNKTQHLYVDGGITIQRFLNAGLIDEMTITIIPILLGEGKPLFDKLDKDIHLNHLFTKAYDFGFVQTKYAVLKN